MVTALIVLAAVAPLLAVIAWQQRRTHNLARHLGHAMANGDRAIRLAEAYLRMLRDAGLCESVDTCQRTRGRTK